MTSQYVLITFVEEAEYEGLQLYKMKMVDILSKEDNNKEFIDF